MSPMLLFCLTCFELKQSFQFLLSSIFTSLKLKLSQYTHSYFYLHFSETSSKVVSQACVVAGSWLADVGWREGGSVGSWPPLRSSPLGSLQASFRTTPTCYHHPLENSLEKTSLSPAKNPFNCTFIGPLKVNVTLITMPTRYRLESVYIKPQGTTAILLMDISIPV